MRLAGIPALAVSLVAFFLSATSSPGHGAAMAAKSAFASMDGLSLLQARANLHQSVAVSLPVGCADLFDGLAVYSTDELLGYCLAQLPEESCLGAQQALGARRPWPLEREAAACHVLMAGLARRAEEAVASSPESKEQAASLSLAALQLRRGTSAKDNVKMLDEVATEKRDYQHAKKVGSTYQINCTNATVGTNANGEENVVVPPNESLPRGCWVAEDYWQKGDVWNGTVVKRPKTTTAAPTGNESEAGNGENETGAPNGTDGGSNNTGAAPAPAATAAKASTGGPSPTPAPAAAAASNSSAGNSSADAAPALVATTTQAATTAAPSPTPAPADAPASNSSAGNSSPGAAHALVATTTQAATTGAPSPAHARAAATASNSSAGEAPSTGAPSPPPAQAAAEAGNSSAGTSSANESHVLVASPMVVLTTPAPSAVDWTNNVSAMASNALDTMKDMFY